MLHTTYKKVLAKGKYSTPEEPKNPKVLLHKVVLFVPFLVTNTFLKLE